MNGLLLDLRLGLRQIARRPGFTAAIVLSLGLGIGANSAVFSLVDATLLRPLPVPEPDRLVAIYTTRPGPAAPGGFSVPDFEDYREALRGEAFTELMGYGGVPFSLAGERAAELVWAERVTEGYFTGLGVEAAAGRLFGPGDLADDPARRLAVLAHGLWRDRFGGDPAVVGRTVQLNGHDYTVVGVAEEGFSGVKFLGFAPEVWVPVGAHAAVDPGSEGMLEDRGWRALQLYGRLAPGVALESAAAAIDAVALRLAADHPEVEPGTRVHLLPGRTKTEPFFHVQLGGVLPLAAAVSMAAVLMVLLVACANVANLLLARAAHRRGEMAVRSALGGGRWRLARQLLAEALLLGAGGGLAGWVLGGWFSELFLLGNPQLDFGIDYGVAMDRRVLLFTLAVSLVTVAVFALVPALRGARLDPAAALGGTRVVDPGGRGRFGRRGRFGARGLLVAGQVALSLALLVAAGLFLRSLGRARAIDPGFRSDGLLVVAVNPGVLGYGPEDGRRLYRELHRRVAALPGVEAATLASPLPLDAFSTTVAVEPDGYEVPADESPPRVFASAVAPGYFEALGTRLERGRAFDAGDGREAPRVAVVNHAFAERFWPGAEAVGKRFRLGDPERTPVTVVGVAADGKYLTLAEAPRPYLYFPLDQRYQSQARVVLRARGDPAALIPAVEAEVRWLDPDLPVYGAKTGAAHLHRSLAAHQGLVAITGFFGVLAALLSAIGVFGVMSYFVSQRTREIGIRMALGAARRDVLRMILRRGLAQTLVGVAAGLALALAAGQRLSGLLLDVSARDPLTFTLVPLGVAAVALLAAFLPARRASRAEPLAALRHE